MTTMQLPIAAAERPRRRLIAQTRIRFLLGTVAAIALTLLTLLQANNAYGTSYELFRGIAEINSTTVDASENALQYIAQASQAAADYALLTSDTPLYEQAQNNIFRSFSSFRDEMSILRDNLQSDDERTAFTVADTFTYSRFWRHVSNLVAQRSNDAVAQREYLDADNHVRNWINPALQTLERINFDQMVAAGENAGAIIITQLVLFAIPALALAALLTYISFALRAKIRRYLTPGIDAALVVSYALILIVTVNLLDAPNQLNTMIQDAYLSVSASSRALVDANLANRAESSVLLDTSRQESWNERFDEASRRVELRLCGRPDCTMTSFVSSGDNLSATALANARNTSVADSAAMDGLPSLVGNVTFRGEAAALEQARLAFVDYRTAHANLSSLIEQGDTGSAILFNTGTDAGSSQEAFNRFAQAIDDLRAINRSVFNQVWEAQRSLLTTNQVLVGLLGYGLIVILVLVGLSHRFREL